MPDTQPGTWDKLEEELQSNQHEKRTLKNSDSTDTKKISSKIN